MGEKLEEKRLCYGCGKPLTIGMEVFVAFYGIIQDGKEVALDMRQGKIFCFNHDKLNVKSFSVAEPPDNGG